MEYCYHNIFRWLIVLLCCILIIAINDIKIAVGCLDSEKIGLLKLKDVLNHQNRSINPSTWGVEQAEDCCRWDGVICSDAFSKRIISLTLITQYNNPPLSYYLYPSEYLFLLDASFFQPFQELQKLNFSSADRTLGVQGPLRLPKLQVLVFNDIVTTDDGFLQGLSNLTTLESLVIEGINVDILNLLPSFTLTPSLWSLTSLKVLGLFGNGIGGALPEGICRLKNLEELDLSQNHLIGVVPTCLSILTSLRLLDLSNNRFSGSIPSNVFSDLKSLEYISLSFNSFVGPIPFGSFFNNSNLEVFELEYNYNVQVDTEIPQLKFPLFQLKVLILSHCILNEPGIPRFLLNQYDLRVVSLDYNNMAGELPSWLISNNSKLESLGLSNNHLTGQLLLQEDAYRADMGWLDVSMNQVEGEIPTFIGSILPNLFYLDMSKNDINGSFPSSIENMRRLELLDLSNNHLFGELREDLFNGCKELIVLKLSNNTLRANLTNFLPYILQLPKLEILYLDSNNFYGDLGLPTLRVARGAPLFWLDISYNSISGRFPDWIAEFTQLYTLILSNNQFEGKLPTSFCNLSKVLTMLDLSYNNFDDFFPPCSNLSLLVYLHMQGNMFRGPLPTSFKRLSIISTLDVRYNKFSGLIPSWIGSLPRLSNLLLKGNRFNGSLPLDLCQLKNLNVLDLSANNLSGLVPICLFHIPFIEHPSPYWYEGTTYSGPALKYSYKRNLSVIPSYFSISYSEYNTDIELQLTTKNRSALYKGTIVLEVYGIDLSLNKFIGQIPSDFQKMEMLLSLNLSNNHFNGSIPWTLSRLTNLESLDLSHNMLSGKIPSELTNLTSLGFFSVAYNNLSGPTPTRSKQFGTFDSDSYEGNPLLCGLPLDKSCSSNGSTTQQHTKSSAEPEQDDTTFKTNFLWSFFGSFVVSCSGAFVYFYFGTNVPQRFIGWLGFEEWVPHKRTIELSWRRYK